MTTTEPSPYPVGSAWERTYGRSVWALGEDGDDGLVIESHEPSRVGCALLLRAARAPSARNAAARLSSTPSTRDALASDVRREEIETCQDLTARSDCDALPPCTDGEMAWMATWYDDPADLPAEALPVLVWGW